MRCLTPCRMFVDVDSAEPTSAAAAAAEPPLELEAVDVDTDNVDADAVLVQKSAPLASASLASAKTVVGSATTDIVERSPPRTHLWLVFLFVMLLFDCVNCVCLFRSCRKVRETKDTRTVERLFAPAAEVGCSIHACWRVSFS